MLRDLIGDKKPRTPADISTQSVMGMTSYFSGRLRSQGNVRLEDIFEGTVISRARVEVGQFATVDGYIYAKSVIVAGIVRGSITAQAIKILDTGKVLGDLRATRVLTEGDAHIQGNILLEAEDFDPIPEFDTTQPKAE